MMARMYSFQSKKLKTNKKTLIKNKIGILRQVSKKNTQDKIFFYFFIFIIFVSKKCADVKPPP